MKIELSVPAELADYSPRELMSSAHCNCSPPGRHGATVKKVRGGQRKRKAGPLRQLTCLGGEQMAKFSRQLVSSMELQKKRKD